MPAPNFLDHSKGIVLGCGKGKLYTSKEKRVILQTGTPEKQYQVQIFVLPPAVSVCDEASGDGPDEHPGEDGAADEALLRS